MIFDGGGGSGPHVPPSGSAHALHPPMSKSRANVLLIFQCPGICLTPSQVDILVSDNSLAFCPTMYPWVETRAKSKLRVRLVPLNMLKLSSFFLLAQIWSIVALSVKNLAFTPYTVCVCVGGSRRYNHSNIHHTPTIGYSITCVDRPRCWRWGGGGGDSGYHCVLLSQRVLVYACAI